MAGRARGLTVVLWHGPHTEQLKANAAGVDPPLSLPVIAPIHNAFDDMIRDGRYDVCEMAIGAYLQAVAAGKPLVLLPLVLAGGFHHKSLYTSPAQPLRDPAELQGGRIGVRSFSQTTGLWVRGWLNEEYGVDPQAVSWLVSEGSHVAEFEDPSNVVRTDGSIADAIHAGTVRAGILGLSDATDLPPVLPDHRRRARAWYERHGFVPINHVVVATEQAVVENPDAIRRIYRDLAVGLDDVTSAPPEPDADGVTLPPARRHGISEVAPCMKLAAAYAFEQRLISAPVDVDQLFSFDVE